MMKEVVRYTCPMHPAVLQERPGMCPECGMQLVPASKADIIRHSGHDKHAGHQTSDFLRKFLISLILTIPVVLYSHLPKALLNWSAPVFPGSAALPLIFGSIIFWYGGWIFLAGARTELRAKAPGMMTLIALAVTAAYSYSVFSIITGSGETLFWELATLITIMLLGHWIEMRAVSGAQGALRELSKLLPDTAEVLRNGMTVTIPLAELQAGDTVLVRPGGRIPADGEVIEGQSEVNEAMVTGESLPVTKTPKTQVIAGTVNGDGSLTIRITAIGEQTFLAGIVRLVAEAQASKSRLQLLADQAARYLTIIAVSVGGLTFALWLIAGAGFNTAIERLVAVLVVACPHALGLAVPLVASISTTLAARHGFLVRQRLALELARSVTTVVFDKTGTLTEGRYGVTNVWSVDNDEQKIIQLAASVDAPSEHFIARAIVTQAEAQDLTLLSVNNFNRIPGRGVRGAIDGTEVSVGGATLLDERNTSLPPVFQAAIKQEAAQGKTIVYVLRSGAVIGAIALADLIRAESREAIAALKLLGVKTVMLTGDAEAVAVWVAGELGLTEYFSKVLPDEKATKVKMLQAKGERVAMVGDGINDAPALTQADVGIAIGAGTNVAIESAGVILVRNDPRDIVRIIKLSRATYTKMLQNLFWATGYNVLALPLAAGALVNQGIILQPAVAAALMSLSTVIVAVNAVLLRRAEI